MHGRSIAHLAGLGWATSMLAALLALGFGGTVFGASQRADPEVAAAWQELQLRLGLEKIREVVVEIKDQQNSKECGEAEKKRLQEIS